MMSMADALLVIVTITTIPFWIGFFVGSMVKK